MPHYAYTWQRNRWLYPCMIRRRLKSILYPFLRKWLQWRLSQPRIYRYKDIRIRVLPGVFHPGWLISTRILLQWLSRHAWKDKSLLELGAGSGLISVYFAQRGAFVTATDISEAALRGLHENAQLNRCHHFEIIRSDLFDSIPEQHFDYIAINPPYYAKDPVTDFERAFYCGAGFGYFHRLSSQLAERLAADTTCAMILSEDCDIQTIRNILESGGLHMEKVSAVRKWWEWNYIFLLKKR